MMAAPVLGYMYNVSRDTNGNYTYNPISDRWEYITKPWHGGYNSGFPGDTIEVRGENLSNVVSVMIGAVPCVFSYLYSTNWEQWVLHVVIPDSAMSDPLFVTNPDGSTQGGRIYVADPKPSDWKPGRRGIFHTGWNAVGDANSWRASRSTLFNPDFSLLDPTTSSLTYWSDVVAQLASRGGSAGYQPQQDPAWSYQSGGSVTEYYANVRAWAGWHWYDVRTQSFIPSYGYSTTEGAKVISCPGAKTPNLRTLQDVEPFAPTTFYGPPWPAATFDDSTQDAEFDALDIAVWEFDPDDVPHVNFNENISVSITFHNTAAAHSGWWTDYSTNPTTTWNYYPDPDPQAATWDARVKASTIRVYRIPASAGQLHPYPPILTYDNGYGYSGTGINGLDQDPYGLAALAGLELVYETPPLSYVIAHPTSSSPYYGDNFVATISLPASLLQDTGAFGLVFVSSLVFDPDGPGISTFYTQPTGAREVQSVTQMSTQVLAYATVPYTSRRYRYYFYRPSSPTEGNPYLWGEERSSDVKFNPAGGNAASSTTRSVGWE